MVKKDGVKLVSWMKRKPGISIEEFNWRWENAHAPLVARKLPGLRRYVLVQHYSTATVEDNPRGIDGVAECYFDSLEDWSYFYNEWYLTEDSKELHDDDLNHVDLSSARFFLGKDIVMIDNSDTLKKGTLKMVNMFKRKAGMSIEELDEFWEKEHGARVARMVPNLRRYVQVHHYSPALLKESHSPLVGKPGHEKMLHLEPEIDGVVELYFDSLKDYSSFTEWYGTKAADALHEDGRIMADPSSVKTFLGREIIIKES